MGLDTTHNCWHAPYSAFNEWRRAICKAAGVSFNREGFTPDNLLGTWEREPSDILDVLIEHSDCDGIIHNRHCDALADRLDGIIDMMPEDEHPFGHRASTKRFAEGLRIAAAAGENVEFH